nr:TMV resistance protein N-like [Tanacetum cinerariifolium]
KEAIFLFNRYAFGKEIQIQSYKELSEKVVCYAAGLPLTIKVLGSFLCGKDDLEWKDAIERLKTIPLKETLEKLELSYNSLEDDYKEIFLDVLCVLKWWNKDEAIMALECCGFHARNGLRVLEQKSLITISEYGVGDAIIRELGSLSSQGINLLVHLKKKVGNGVHTLFLDDTWINDILLSQTYPRLYALESKKHIIVAEKLSVVSLIVSFRRAPRGGVEEDQFLWLVDLVASVILSNSNDRWVWLLDSSGEYLVSSACSYIDDLLLTTVGYPTRWVKVVPIKIKIFTWKVCLDKLPTRLNLSLRGIDKPSIISPFCSLAGESCSYLLFSCSMARILWRKVARWWDFDIPEFSFYDCIAWFNSMRISKVVKDVLEGVFYVM